MTRKDIDNIISIICPNDEDFEKPIISPAYLKKELEALALEQEPSEKDWRFYYDHGYAQAKRDLSCEDAISRQAVNILVDELARAISDERCCMSRGRSTATIMQDILDLPSVKQEPKTGHREYNDIYDHYLCGNCKTIVMDYDNFCPNCGAKMVEPQESEVRNENNT